MGILYINTEKNERKVIFDNKDYEERGILEILDFELLPNWKMKVFFTTWWYPNFKSEEKIISID